MKLFTITKRAVLNAMNDAQIQLVANALGLPANDLSLEDRIELLMQLTSPQEDLQ